LVDTRKERGKLGDFRKIGTDDNLKVKTADRRSSIGHPEYGHFLK
jgi:hypothetical protein